jgi:hypothetical protein
MQNALSGVAAPLRAAGADVSFDDSSLRITVVFSDRAALINQLGGLTHALPASAEWSLVRAVFSPAAIEWADADEALTHVTRYSEAVDLSAACGMFTAQIDAGSKNLAPLDNAAANDDEAQLKRALLSYAQRGWQTALAQGGVIYQVGSNETRVEPCAARAVAIASSTFLPVRVALIVAVVELVGIGILVVRWRGRKK